MSAVYGHTPGLSHSKTCTLTCVHGCSLWSYPRTLADIAEELLEAGAICKRYGVEKICIGGVPVRPGVQGRCYDLNRILSRRCRARNYVFIDNKYIFLGHLYDDVHLNHHGVRVLANNYLDVLNVAIVPQ